MTDEADYLNGRMLIAMPGIGDARFERSLLYVCHHDGEQAMAISVNKPADGLTVPELLRKLGVEPEAGIAEAPVMLGGPVGRERGHVLHTDDYAGDNGTAPAGDGLAITATRDVLAAMAHPASAPRRAMLALGYAGWGPGQLERELQENVWLTCDADEALLFGADHEAKWAAALGKIGVTPAMLSAQAGRA